ncbi:MAG: hypothetical protein JXA11_09505 [Phycisphaerae bacterium]|nr:hypothetical protein [Phycisphaerae bacterium]
MALFIMLVFSGICKRQNTVLPGGAPLRVLVDFFFFSNSAERQADMHIGLPLGAVGKKEDFITRLVKHVSHSIRF